MNAENAENSKARRNLRCPRCGYDLRGVVQAWAESCPLAGRCTECGLEFEWSMVFHPELYEPTWCVEFAAGWRNVLRACISTAWRALWPWRFWKRMNMSFEARWRRIALYGVFLLLLLVPLYVFEQASVAVAARLAVEWELQQSYSPGAQIRVLEQSIAKLEELEFGDADDGRFRYIASADERDRLVARQRQTIQFLKSGGAGPPTVQHSAWDMLTEALLHPRSSRSSGQIRTQWGNLPYPGPDELHNTVANTLHSITPANVDWEPFRVLASIWAALALTLVVFIPLEFALLPISRRKARVRWRHIWRVAVYSALLAVEAALIVAVILTIAFVTPGSISRFGSLGFAIGVLPAAAVAVTWAVAIRRYLRMPHGWLIVLLFSVLGVLLATFLIPLTVAILQLILESG